MATNQDFKANLLSFINPRFLHTVATKKCIYSKLQESIPFATMTFKECSEEQDEVTMKFGEETVKFDFMWKRPEKSVGSHVNYNLYKIV